MHTFREKTSPQYIILVIILATPYPICYKVLHDFAVLPYPTEIYGTSLSSFVRHYSPASPAPPAVILVLCKRGKFSTQQVFLH